MCETGEQFAVTDQETALRPQQLSALVPDPRAAPQSEMQTQCVPSDDTIPANGLTQDALVLLHAGREQPSTQGCTLHDTLHRVNI